MERYRYQDWGQVDKWRGNTLASKLKGTVPAQWARGIDALALRDPDEPRWRRSSAWVERLEAFREEHGGAVVWHMGDSDICERAKAVAEGAETMMSLWPAPLDEAARVALVKDVCALMDVDAPDAATPAGVIGKGLDALWWRRRLRKKVARMVEHGAIKLGLVNRSDGGYCSNDAVDRRRQQLERAQAMMSRTLVRNEAGQVYALDELAKLTVSNRDVRRGELMTRIRGCEEYADAEGHVGMFFTLTLPSRFHAMLAPPPGSNGRARRNPRYDGASPRDGQMWLRTMWARTRAELDKAGIGMYGFRVAEPHHDACPHWHALVWFANEAHAAEAGQIIKKHWLSDDGNQPGARKNRVNIKRMELGGAAGYIAKYIAKNVGGSYNVDGHVDGTGGEQQDFFEVDSGAVQGYQRVDAWAATWGIRQFQALGQPSVTVWRELRRVTKDQVERARIEGDTIAWKAWGAAQREGMILASWRGFMVAMGGACRKRGEWAMAPAKRETEEKNQYGETVTKKVTVGLELRSGRWLISRRQAWSRVAEGRQDPESRARMGRPWTGFNNCRARLTGELRRAFMGRGRHEIEDWTPQPPPIPVDRWTDEPPPWSDDAPSSSF